MLGAFKAPSQSAIADSSPGVRALQNLTAAVERMVITMLGRGRRPRRPVYEQFNQNKRREITPRPTINLFTSRLRWNERLPPYTVGVDVLGDPCTNNSTKTNGGHLIRQPSAATFPKGKAFATRLRWNKRLPPYSVGRWLAAAVNERFKQNKTGRRRRRPLPMIWVIFTATVEQTVTAKHRRAVACCRRVRTI